MSRLEIPTHNVSDESMGDGWRDQAEAATAFASYLEEHVPGMVADEGDEVEFEAKRTGNSGAVNNACAYPTVDGEDSDILSYRVQHAKEVLWERFCNERGDLAA